MSSDVITVDLSGVLTEAQLAEIEQKRTIRSGKTVK